MLNTTNNPFINTTGINVNPYAQGSVAGYGFNGFPGINGFSGINGLTGINGFPGISGLAGIAGLPGINSLAGLGGIAGVPSVNPLAGINGLNPLIALQAINALNTLNSLTGVNGLTGTNGLTGALNPWTAGYGAATHPVNTAAAYPVNASANTAWVPNIHISENETVLQVAVELPGVKEQDVEVMINGNFLTVRGEKTGCSFGGQTVTRYAECYAGSFYRCIQLTDTPVTAEEQYDISRVNAEFHNGILIVSIPKAHEARAQFKRVDLSKRSKSGVSV